MMVPAAARLLLLLQTNKGAIEGAVMNSVTGKPIAGAQVQATKITGPTACGGMCVIHHASRG
jgi:hypothetical protein